MSGLRLIATSSALATSSSGLTRSPAMSLSGLELLDQLHRARHVDRDELGDVRRGERGADHRLGGRLAHALDRDPRLAARRTAWTGRRRSGSCFDVKRGAACGRPGAAAACTSSRVTMPSGPVGTTVARSMPEVLGELAHRRLGERAGRGRAPWPFSSVGTARRASAGAGSGTAAAPCAGGAWSRPRTRRSRPGRAGGPWAPPPRRARRAPRARQARRRTAPRRAGAGPLPGATSTVMIAVPTSTVTPSSKCSVVHHAVEGDRQLDGRLRGLDLAHDLAVGDGVAGLDVPLEDLGLGQPLADVRHLELAVAGSVLSHRRHDSLLSTPASGRRRRAPGRGPAGTPPRAATAGTGRGSRRPAAPAPPGGRSTAR